MFKKILIILLIVFVLIQFIRPAKNKSDVVSPHDISTKYPVPDSVQQILKVACNDCHSNNTQYPWYSEIQPVGWWLSNHIKDGKRVLNFSEFISYRIKKQFHRVNDIEELVKKDEMPLSSYTLIHTNAKLSPHQKLILANWTESLKDSIKAHYPPDSLLGK
ncbi:MAG: heme-binding domain-containing protein [Bacteroidota bacterium]|nr:heme-binding domain-containing protein [Bacteroidota bacterium]